MVWCLIAQGALYLFNFYNNILIYVRFEVLTAITAKNIIVWDVT
jgi:hypothetical protein